MLLQRGWVVLGLLENALHDWILEDAHDLHEQLALSIIAVRGG
jgi:hypothetical protein